jgi:hypothetical protein
LTASRSSFLILSTAALLFAADPAWMNKPIAGWTPDDAKQFLTDSPWVGTAQPQNIADRSPGERRDSGDWDAGVGRGVGIAGTGILGSRRAREAIKEAHEKPVPAPVPMRWESALPVRAAEKKAGQTTVSSMPDNWYSIVLYDVPLSKRWNATKLKGVAYIKRANGPDIKAARVEVLRHDDEDTDSDTAILIYMFPRTQEISARDRDIIFVAQIDRLFVTRYFHPFKMQIAGNLEL